MQVMMESIETIDERIAAAEAAIASLPEEFKAKKAELKRYRKKRSGSRAKRKQRRTRLPF